MKFTTYGLWNIARLQLVDDLSKIPELHERRHEVEDLLLEEVITAILEKAYVCQDDLARNNPNMPLKEKVLITHKQSLTAVLPCLVSKLNLSEDKINQAVASFCARAYEFSETHVDYLLRLAEVSGQAKNEIIDELYGNCFRSEHAALARRLQFNDGEVLKKATDAVRQEIIISCPSELQNIMQEHCLYMKEVAAQKEPNSTFYADFQAEMHQSMEEFKQKIKEQKHAQRFFKLETLENKTESTHLTLK
ncbi:MAG: hypothetical protein BGO90_03550 [Legionella sp. 40-6]|nr:hypothetical protein [Legionella sp.]OJY37160.1 MAG: hypothetical protein BGO90_03550 [Legionella sp. 40-6]